MRGRRIGRAAALAAALALPLAGCEAPPPPRGLLLITVDTLRADALGAYGASGGLTPRLDALARESLVFDAAYATAPFTLPSLASLLTGRYPAALGVRSNAAALPPGTPTLASALRAHGFATGAAVGSAVLLGPSTLSQAFELWDDALAPSPRDPRLRERTAAANTDAALALLDRLAPAPERGRARWMLWVHYQDPHGPYTPPDPFSRRARALEPDAGRLDAIVGDHGGGGIPRYQQLGDEREVAAYRAAYRGEVAYLDGEIGRLLDGVGARGLLAQALVVFTADHGEALGEHGVYFAHGHDLTDELVRVPLLLRDAGLGAGRRSDLASLVDLYPTLLARLVGAPPDALPGRDLLAPRAAEGQSLPLLDTLAHAGERRVGLVTEDFKVILGSRGGAVQTRLFRRGREDEELAGASPQIAAELRDRANALLRRTEAASPPSLSRELSSEERARLEALGYAGEGK